jgi:hypothetical protein
MKTHTPSIDILATRSNSQNRSAGMTSTRAYAFTLLYRNDEK